MLIFNVRGKAAISIRALPLFSPGFFDPRAVLGMLSDPESLADAPALRPFRVDKHGVVKNVHPTEFHYPLKELAEAGGKFNFEAELEAMPPGVMVELNEARASFDFLDEQVSLTESLTHCRPFPRAWLPSPYMSDSIQKIVCEGTDRLQPFGGVNTSVAKRKRLSEGTNIEVQEIADKLAKEYHAKDKKWPGKKELLRDLADQLNHRTAEQLTLLREFKATWKNAI